MMSDAYDSPPPRTAGSAMAGKSRLLESSGDEAYAKMQARLHSRSAQRPFGTPEPARQIGLVRRAGTPAGGWATQLAETLTEVGEGLTGRLRANY